MPWNKIYHLYQELQSYIGWTDDDARRVGSVASLMEPHVVELIDDFYDEISRHPDAQKVITGGAEQVKRLKGTLRAWLRDLVSGKYDLDYVVRRWRVGYRHVEIGLAQVYTNAALSRLRRGITQTLERNWTGDPRELLFTTGGMIHDRTTGIWRCRFIGVGAGGGGSCFCAGRPAGKGRP